MQAVLTGIRRLEALPILLACVVLFVLMIMTFCDVVLRSVANSPIEAATELTRIFVAIMVFSVLPHISVTGGHIAVDLADPLFDRLGLNRWRDGLVYLASAIMMIWPVQRVYVLAERARSYGDVTEYLAIPQFYIMWFIAIFTGLTALAMFVTGLLTLFAPRVLEAQK